MKRLCWILSVVLVLSSVLSSLVLAQAPGDSALYETYTFDFSDGSMPALMVNETACTDSRGNAFFPFHSASDQARASLQNIDVVKAGAKQTVDTLEIVAPAPITLIPVDRNGKPYEIMPGATYEVTVSAYVKCSGTYSQIFCGGGVYGAYKSGYSTTSTQYPGSNKGKFQDMNVKYPVFRTESWCYRDWGGNYYSDEKQSKTVRYFESYSDNKSQYFRDTYTFTTGEYDQRKKGFELTAANGTNALFGNYFALMTDGGMVNVYDAVGNLVTTAPVQYNISEITITKIAQKELKKSETVTFDFDAGTVPEVTVNSTAATDSKGNTFYPFHSASSSATAVQKDIDVTTKDGHETVSTLELASSGRTFFVPLDETGKPYEILPNSEYEVKVAVFVKTSGTYTQLFFGGGLYGAYQAAYSTSETTYPGNCENVKKNIKAIYPVFRSDSVAYQDWGGNYYSSASLSSKVRHFTDFTTTNSKQYYNTTVSFTTENYAPGTTGFSLTNDSGSTATFGDYFGLMFEGQTVNAYDDSGTLVTSQPVTYYIDKIEITRVMQKAPVTLHANGGTFDGKETAAEDLTVGGPLTVATPPTRDGYLLSGWSLTPDGEILNGPVDATLTGKILYAVWEEDLYEGYDRYERTVDFSQWTVRVNNNAWAYTHDNTTDAPYFSIKRDGTMLGGSYLHCHYGASQGGGWLGNFNITVTPSGRCNTTGEGDENVVLPTNTTYCVTTRVRVNYTNKPLSYYVAYGNDFSTAAASFNGYTLMQSDITATDGFVELVGYFTTPEVYSVNKESAQNRFFIGLTTGGSTDADYDIDFIRLQKMAKATVYTVSEGAPAYLQNETVVRPGSFVSLPDSVNQERYHTEDTRADVTKALVSAWYSDPACTVPLAEKRVGNGDTAFYGKLAEEQVISDENQVGYCGFDTYVCEYDEGVLYTDAITGKGAQITNEIAYTGQASLQIKTGKETPAYLSAFELRNRRAFGLADHTTYRVNFSYRADGDFTLGFGVGKANDCAHRHLVLAQTECSASDTFVRGCLVMETDFASAQAFADSGLSPMGLVTAQNDVTVYLDDITLSRVVTNVGVSRLVGTQDRQALRFYMAYESDQADTLSLAGETHGISKRGILLKNASGDTPLILENAGKGGVVNGERNTAFDTCWSQNPVTDVRVFSVCVKNLSAGDTRAITARGYVVLDDGSVYYGNTVTACVADLPDPPDALDMTALDRHIGLIHHSSQTGSLVSGTTGESMNDAYFFLPVGTVITSGTPYRVFLYNEFFELDTALMSAFGESFAETFEPDAITGDFVMQSGSYVRLCSDGALTDITITVPTEQQSFLSSGKREDMMYDTEMAQVMRHVRQTAQGCVNYLFITDIHYDSSGSASDRNALVRQMNTVTRMANEDDTIDFVAIGGDTTTGMYGSREAALKDTNRILEPLQQCKKPVLVLNGNHDDNCYHTYWSGGIPYRPALVLGDKEWTDGVLAVNCPATIVHDSQQKDSKYFYYDLTDKKTRIVCLDAVDYPYEKDAQGNLIDMTVKDESKTTSGRCYSGATYWGYSARQLTWLMQEAFRAPDGYDYIVLSHMGIDYDTNCYQGTVMYSTQLRSLLAAFQNKTVFKDAAIGTADFAESTGRILCYQFGHMHAELVMYSADVDLWQICTATPSIDQYSSTLEPGSSVNNKKLDWRYYQRQYNTISEASLDVMTVGRGVIHKYAFGAGGDYKLYND